jgi:cellulose synthase/poly-beta-1,6-N-acetylglucosamine synthase-like glycosyltransferase
VARFLAQTYPHLEVIVLDDRSNDGTGDVARRVAPGDPRLIVLRGEEPPPGWLGKPWALQQGARRARGDLLLFVDADVRYEPAAVAAMVAFRERTSADLVAILPRIEMRGFGEHVLMPQLACFLFRSLPVFIVNRSRVPALAAGGGVGNLVVRRTYERSGTHEALRDAVIDDVGLARLVRNRGGTTRVALADELVAIRVYRGSREIVAGFTKNLFPLFGWAGTALLGILWVSVHVAPHVIAAAGVLRLLSTSHITALETWSLAGVGAIALSRAILFRALDYRLDVAILGELPMSLGWLYILARSAWVVGVRRRIEWRGRFYSSVSRFGTPMRRECTEGEVAD